MIILDDNITYLIILYEDKGSPGEDYSVTTKCGQVECDRQNGDLSLVELIQILCSDWLRYQLSYDIKTQLKAPKPLLGASRAFAVSLCLWLIKGAFFRCIDITV